MAKRKNVTALTGSEKQAFIDAVWALKRERPEMDGLSTYDRYVVWHQRTMNRRTPWDGDQQPTSRNSAHRGPVFLPWHREYLRRFEKDLQRVSGVSDLGLPYWDWADDGSNTTPDQQKQAPVWDLVGHDGDASQSFIVTDGPFAIDPARLNDPTVFDDPDVWLTVDGNGRRNSVLLRRMGLADDGQGGRFDTLPTKQEEAAVLAIPNYDAGPWNESTQNSFRNALEGWPDNPGGPPGMHNRVHVWVGGSMGPGTSPNDPVFFLNHCNVDRIWAEWQEAHPPGDYEPQSSGPPGHNLTDPMYPWDGVAMPDVATPESVLDLGDVEYE